MARDGDFEAGMCCATTFKKKSSNARGCNTKNNFALGAKMIAECVI